MIDPIVKAFEASLKAESIVKKMPTETLAKDREFLESLGKPKIPKLSRSIETHLVSEGRQGSAEFIGLFTKSLQLDKEVELFEKGSYNSEKLKDAGLSLFLDTEKTTIEMLENGQGVLTPEGNAELLGSVNRLSFRIDEHIRRTADIASEHYAGALTNNMSLVEKMRKMIGIKTEPHEIPLNLTEDELARLEEFNGTKALSQEEAKGTIKHVLNNMAMNRPDVFGLGHTGLLSRNLKYIANGMGGENTGAVNIKNLSYIFESGVHNDILLAELQISPEFTDAIRESIQRDTS
jgi:hypothetical protein